MVAAAPDVNPSSDIALRSLSPRYEEAHHELYVQALVAALRDEGGIRNIALTGAYGTGKSSVLQRLADLPEFRERVLELSLSSVGVAEQRPEGESDANPAAWTKANLIQKEIVKQILYRDPPEKTRGSRFRRLSRFRWKGEMGISAGLGALLLAIGWVTGITTPLLTWLGESPALWWLLTGYAVLLTVLTGVVYSLRWLTHNRVFLEKLSAGPATVSLAPTSSSFFDQYMDEIVYYFEQSGRDIVIFEDIDRFEDIHIFETLRALNALLNGSEQIRRRRRDKAPKDRRLSQPIDGEQPVTSPQSDRLPDVKFIYALRDSVFERLGSDPEPTTGGESAKAATMPRDDGNDEVQRANRTKFFDLVIPVVPFITHRNARDLMLKAMEGTDVSRDLINVAARFVADMRLITDLRNEYDIYAHRLLAPPTAMPGIDPDRLFTLILYKSVHMADFEAIRLGSSTLDDLYDAWRQIVNDSLLDAYDRDRAATIRREAKDVDVARAAALGDRLELVARAITPYQPRATYISLNGQQHRGDELREPEFWRRITSPDASVLIVNQYSPLNLTLSRSQLETLMGQTMDEREWKQIDHRAAAYDQKKARADIHFLRHHEWSQIYGRPEFTSKPTSGSPESFAAATDRILRSKLARTLVAAGYLDQYFALYVSIYYGQHLRPRALNYAIHALDRGVPDLSADLDGEDVEAIIIDMGTDIFRDRAAYNINVLDHLLTKRRSEAEMMVRQLATWDEPDRTFAEAYLKSGKEQVSLVRLLAPLMPSTITSFVINAPREILPAVVDAALDYAGASIEGPVINQTVLDNYRQFPSISATAQTGEVDLRKHKTMDAIAKLGLQLPATEPLTQDARGRAVALSAYQLNEANIADLTGQASLALDAILAQSRPVFDVALARADEYLALLRSRDGAHTINDPKQFLPILKDATEVAVDPKHVNEIIKYASSACHVENVADAPESVWLTLASDKRITPTAINLITYLDHVGSIDDSAAQLLEDVQEIPIADDLSSADRDRLALGILNAGDSIPSADHRVKLAVSLDPTSLQINSLTPESGPMTSLLIGAGLLPDDETTFSSKLILDWSTREAALALSRRAQDFISPLTLPPDQLAEFFNSDHIPRALKTAVLHKIQDFLPTSGNDAVHATTRFAIDVAADLPITTIHQLKESGAPDRDVVALLAHSASVTPDQVRDQLRALDDPYPAIADRGYSKPVVPDDEAHRCLLDVLQEAGIVSQHERDGQVRRVYLRRPPRE